MPLMRWLGSMPASVALPCRDLVACVEQRARRQVDGGFLERLLLGRQIFDRNHGATMPLKEKDT